MQYASEPVHDRAQAVTVSLFCLLFMAPSMYNQTLVAYLQRFLPFSPVLLILFAVPQ